MAAARFRPGVCGVLTSTHRNAPSNAMQAPLRFRCIRIAAPSVFARCGHKGGHRARSARAIPRRFRSKQSKREPPNFQRVVRVTIAPAGSPPRPSISWLLPQGELGELARRGVRQLSTNSTSSAATTCDLVAQEFEQLLAVESLTDLRTPPGAARSHLGVCATPMTAASATADARSRNFRFDGAIHSPPDLITSLEAVGDLTKRLPSSVATSPVGTSRRAECCPVVLEIGPRSPTALEPEVAEGNAIVWQLAPLAVDDLQLDAEAGTALLGRSFR